jgi:hypothetical protein
MESMTEEEKEIYKIFEENPERKLSIRAIEREYAKKDLVIGRVTARKRLRGLVKKRFLRSKKDGIELLHWIPHK